MRFPENAPRNPDELLERRDGLQHVSASSAVGFELGPSVQTAHLESMALRVLGAFLDRDRDGLLVFFVGVKLLRVAAAVYFLTHLLVAAAPVVMLASFVAVSRLASIAVRSPPT